MIELCDALGLSVEALGAGLNRCFEEYVIPINFTPLLVSMMLRTDAVDLAHTVVAMDQGEVAGMLLVCRRGKRMRIGAMGVAKPHRSTGVGGQLIAKALAAAKERGDETAVLEAIEHNTRAIAFYERHGFKTRFRLISGQISLTAGEAADDLVEIAIDELAVRVLDRCDGASSWVVSGGEVAQLALPALAYDSEGLGVAVHPLGDDSLLCRGIALSDKDNERKLGNLLAGLGKLHPGRHFKVPPFYPEPEFGVLFDAVGMERESLSQVQMEQDLRS